MFTTGSLCRRWTSSLFVRPTEKRNGLKEPRKAAAKRRSPSAAQRAFARTAPTDPDIALWHFIAIPHNLLFVAKLRVYLAPEPMPPTPHRRACFAARYRLLHSLLATAQAEHLLLVCVLAANTCGLTPAGQAGLIGRHFVCSGGL